MVRPASRESNLGISTSYESNFEISTSYEAFANFETMAAKEQLIDYLHGLSSPIGENRYPDSKWQLFIAWSNYAVLLGDYILDHEIDVEETQQRSLFELFRKANGGEEVYSSNQGWQPTSTKRVLLQRPQSSPSQEDTLHGHGLHQPVFHLQ